MAWVSCVRTIVVWKLSDRRTWSRRAQQSCCVRTIVVWKPFISGSSLPFALPGCVRTIVVWKRLNRAAARNSWIALRKNHSGMETRHTLRLKVKHQTCCVRTIVVWKLPFSGSVILYFQLRKNHSGMETFGQPVCLLYSYTQGCVRTIVVWKQHV